MNKGELIKSISKRTGLSNHDAKTTLEVTLELLTKTLDKGETIKIIGFGSFIPTERKGRVYNHPRTREKIKVPSKNKIKFKPSELIFEKVYS